MHIPTGQIQQDVQTTVTNTTNSGTSADTRVEYGGHTIFGDANARLWDKGQPQVKTTKTNDDGTVITTTQWSTNAFQIDGRTQIGGTYSDLEYIWHVHPNASTPSETDITTFSRWRTNGFTGNAFVVGIENGKVTFYNEKGSLITVKYSEFLKMGKQEGIE
jgi:hypothetical protein